jgi:hypothetical protein
VKKDRKTPGKLTLNRETLRHLEEEHLREVAGGATVACPSADHDCTVTRHFC